MLQCTTVSPIRAEGENGGELSTQSSFVLAFQRICLALWPFHFNFKVWLTNSVTLTVNVEVVKMYKNEMKSPEIYMIFAKGEFLSLFPYLGQLKNTFFTDTICYFNISHRQIN